MSLFRSNKILGFPAHRLAQRMLRHCFVELETGLQYLSQIG